MPGAEAATAAYRRPREDVCIEAARDDDRIGVQSCTRTRIGTGSPVPAPADAERTLTGREYNPQAIGHALRHTAEIVGDVPPDRHRERHRHWPGGLARTGTLPRVTS